MKSEPEPIRTILSKNIKKYRENLHYTQEKLAERAGLSAQTLNDIEGCRRWVSAKTITKLAKALSIQEYQLLLPEEKGTLDKDNQKSIKTLIALKKNINEVIEKQFEKAIDTGNFKLS